jgi:hypothetical protein
VGKLYHSGAEPWSDCAALSIRSGAVEERQRDEFWTDSQVQLLFAAIILTGIGRSRSFMFSKAKIISAADGDMSPEVDEAAVSGAFGIWHDH